MDRIQRLKIVLDSMKEFKSSPVDSTSISRFCTLTDCLMSEVEHLLEETAGEDEESGAA